LKALQVTSLHPRLWLHNTKATVVEQVGDEFNESGN